MCKPILVTMADGKTVHLSIVARHFAIGIYDEQERCLTGKAVFCADLWPMGCISTIPSHEYP